ncbi:unnamed protein product [Diamesa tonsa]
MKTTLDKFFCCELKNGAICIGTFGTLLSFLLCVECMKEPRVLNNEVDLENDYQHASTSFAFFYSLSYFVSSVLLIVGAAKSNLKLLIPFLTVHPIVCLILSVAAFVLENIEVFSLAVLVNYCWLCVWSLHKALKTEEKNQLTAQYDSDPPPPYQDFDSYPTSVFISHPPIARIFPTASIGRNAPIV